MSREIETFVAAFEANAERAESVTRGLSNGSIQLGVGTRSLFRLGPRLARASARLDLGRVRVTLPTLPPILRDLVSMPLGARFALIAAHDRRHLWQAQQVRDHPDFS